MTYRVSVIVPTFKRPDLLNHCLAALLAQDFDRADYEVIVVDDAPDDNTKQLVECFARQLGTCGPRLRYIPAVGAERIETRSASSAECPPPMYRPSGKSTHGPAVARNIGWRA